MAVSRSGDNGRGSSIVFFSSSSSWRQSPATLKKLVLSSLLHRTNKHRRSRKSIQVGQEAADAATMMMVRIAGGVTGEIPAKAATADSR